MISSIFMHMINIFVHIYVCGSTTALLSENKDESEQDQKKSSLETETKSIIATFLIKDHAYLIILFLI